MVEANEVKVAKVSPPGSAQGSKDRKKRRKTPKQSYKKYIYQVLKQVHPDVRIKPKTLTILDSFCNDLFERIAAEAEKLAKVRGKVTVTSLDVQTAVKLLVPGDLAKHAIAEGAKAVTKFNFNPTT